jgi:asparagine synthetase B (glutamine-hydrolysing)
MKNLFRFKLEDYSYTQVLAAWGDFPKSETDPQKLLASLKSGTPGVLVLFDQDEIQIYRDSLGIEPAYVSLGGNEIRISREPFFSANPVVNKEYFAKILAHDFTAQNLTADKRVSKVMAGHVFHFGKKGTRQSRWYHPVVRQQSRSREDLELELKSLIQLNMASLFEVCRPVLLWSGGLDSSILSAEGKRYGIENISIEGLQQGEGINPGSIEFLKNSGMRWHRLKIEDHLDEFEWQPENEPFGHYVFTVGLLRPLMEKAQNCGFDTVLTGHGGDDLFTLNSPRLAFHLVPRSSYKILRLAYHFVIGGNQYLRNNRVRELKKWHQINKLERSEYNWHQTQLVTRFFNTGLYPFGFEQEQIFAGRYGLKYRHPLLHQNIFEFLLNVPESEWSSTSLGKEFLRRTYKEITLDQLTTHDFSQFCESQMAVQQDRFNKFLCNSRLQKLGIMNVERFLRRANVVQGQTDRDLLQAVLYCEQLLEKLG